jgi:hypothetical protein
MKTKKYPVTVTPLGIADNSVTLNSQELILPHNIAAWVQV